MSEELRPCPFCGGHMRWNDNEFESAYVCDDCHYFIEWDGMLEEFVKWWNARPIEDALNARIAELEEKQRWIPVSERLPEVGKVVHVIDMNDIGGHLCNLYETAVLVEVSGNKRFGFIGHSGWDTSDVTHWMYAMPLPTPPEVQE